MRALLPETNRSSRQRLRELDANRAALEASETGDVRLVTCVKQASALRGVVWHEANRFLLKRGPYLIGAGLDETVSADPTIVKGRFINLFDAELRLRERRPETRLARFPAGPRFGQVGR